MRAALDDPEFRRRLAKLVAMLSADNPAEAEAARQKLRAHLATRQLSMLDLAQRLVAGRDAAPVQVPALEEALRRSRAETLAALQRAIAAERALARRRPADAARGWMAIAAIAALAAVGGAAVGGAVLWSWPRRPIHGMPMSAASAPPLLPDRGAPEDVPISPGPDRGAADRPVFSWQPEPDPGTVPIAPSARSAFVRGDRTPLRERASGAATLRAVLPRGLPVMVVRTERRGGEDWSLVQTSQGRGYVAAAAITAAAR